MGSGVDVFISWDFWVLELTLLCKKGAEVVSWENSVVISLGSNLTTKQKLLGEGEVIAVSEEQLSSFAPAASPSCAVVTGRVTL